MYFLLLKNFLVSRVVIVGLLIVFFAGLLGIYNGYRHTEKLKSNIEKTAQFQQEHINRNAAFFNKNMGLLLYYLRFAYVNEADPLNGLSIGQRDVNNSIQFINIRNLEAEKYDADLYNPVNLLIGNLDFSFVLLYLFPLLIIAVSYNLWSEEKEGGTWALLAVQSRNPVKVLFQKLSVRALVIFGLLAVLFAVAIAVLGIRFNASLVATIIISSTYLLFWFTVCFWIISWKRSSSENAASLLTAWVLLNFIVPALVNNYIISRYPVPEALATTVEQREGYHARWDTDKNETMEGFYQHYPQYRKYTLEKDQSGYLWYYAMQQAGDDAAREDVLLLKQKLRQRNNTSSIIAMFIPTIHTQLKLNSLGGSDLNNHLLFLDSTETFHERLRMHFYPKIFEKQEAKNVDWSGFKPDYFVDNRSVDYTQMILPLLMSALFFAALCWWGFSRSV